MGQQFRRVCYRTTSYFELWRYPRDTPGIARRSNESPYSRASYNEADGKPILFRRGGYAIEIHVRLLSKRKESLDICNVPEHEDPIKRYV